jgi:hypothetical protein
MAEKKTTDSKSKSESKPKDMKFNIRLKNLAIHAQTRLFAFGIALPVALVWLGTYLMFTFPALLVQIAAFLKNFTAAQIPSIYSNVLLPMNANSGLAFYAVGIVMYLFALIIARMVATRSNLAELKLGEIRVRSLLMTVLLAFIIAAVIVSLANRVLFDPLLALQGA